MIQFAIKNYFNNLKYVFSVMGIVYLSLIISVLALLSGAGGILSSAAISSGEQLLQYLNDVLSEMTLEKLFSEGFLTRFLQGVLQIFRDGGNNVIVRITALFTAVLSLFLLGCKLSAWHTRRLIRKDMSDGETKRGLVVLIARYLFGLIGTMMVAVCIYYWVFSAIFLLIAFAVVKAAEQLVTTWFVYCKKSFALKEVFRASYILKLVAANGVSVAVNLVILLLIAAAVNVPFALLISIPLFIYSFVILDFTTVSFFKNLKTAKQLLPCNQTKLYNKNKMVGIKKTNFVSKATKVNQGKPQSLCDLSVSYSVQSETLLKKSTLYNGTEKPDDSNTAKNTTLKNIASQKDAMFISSETASKRNHLVGNEYQQSSVTAQSETDNCE